MCVQKGIRLLVQGHTAEPHHTERIERAVRNHPSSGCILLTASCWQPDNLRVVVVAIEELSADVQPRSHHPAWLSSGANHAVFWEHGPATVRELHTVLANDAPLTYNTVMTTCNRLVEKGLLERRRVTPDETALRAKQAYVYTARLSEVDLLRRGPEAPVEPPFAGIRHHVPHGSQRASIEQLLAYLGTLRDADGHAIDERALDSIAALLERAESAERAILIYQAEALRALHRAASAECRAEMTGDSSVQTKPDRRRTKPVPAAAVYEYPGDQKICRVCGRPAPPPYATRRDDLRVCSLESCREEARRRDNVAKQRRSVARKRSEQNTLAEDEGELKRPKRFWQPSRS